MIDLSKLRVAINSDIILKVRDDLEVEKYYGDVQLVKEDKDLIGKEVVFEKTDLGYIFIKNSSRVFSPKMFESTIKIRINNTEIKLDVDRDKNSLRKGDTFIDKYDRNEWRVLMAGKDKLHNQVEYYCERVEDGLTELWNPEEIEKII